MASIARVHYTEDFKRAYQKLPQHVQRACNRKDVVFRQNPFHPGLKTHKLHGPLKGLCAYSITRSYRVLFEFLPDNAVICYDVGTHAIYE